MLNVPAAPDGRDLRRRRRSLDLPQRAVASRLGIARQRINAAERNGLGATASLRARISAALDALEAEQAAAQAPH